MLCNLLYCGPSACSHCCCNRELEQKREELLDANAHRDEDGKSLGLLETEVQRHLFGMH